MVSMFWEAAQYRRAGTMFVWKKVFLCTLVLNCIVAQTSSGQSFVMHPLPELNSRVSLRFLRHSSEGVEKTLFSGTYELLFDIVSRESLNFQASIPYSITKYDGHDVEAGLGNIYVGVARCLSQVEETVSAILYGVYIPTLDSHSSVYGTHYQEPPAYFNQTISLSMSYRYHRVTRRGFIFGLDVGPDLVLPKNNAPDIILHYGFSGGFRFEALAVVAELCGIRWLGGGLRPFGDELRNHSIAIGAELRSGSFRPAAFYQTRLDEEPGGGFHGVLGVQCSVIFG